MAPDRFVNERARSLLSDSNAPLADIARRLGFATPASFSYAFRRATGVRPSEADGRRRSRARSRAS